MDNFGHQRQSKQWQNAVIDRIRYRPSRVKEKEERRGGGLRGRQRTGGKGGGRSRNENPTQAWENSPPRQFWKLLNTRLSINLLMGHIDWLSECHQLNMIKSIAGTIFAKAKAVGAQTSSYFFVSSLMGYFCFEPGLSIRNGMYHFCRPIRL